MATELYSFKIRLGWDGPNGELITRSGVVGVPDAHNLHQARSKLKDRVTAVGWKVLECTHVSNNELGRAPTLDTFKIA